MPESVPWVERCDYCGAPAAGVDTECNLCCPACAEAGYTGFIAHCFESHHAADDCPFPAARMLANEPD